MTQKKSTSTKTSTTSSSSSTTSSSSKKSSSGYSVGYIVNILAFVAVVFCGLALFIAMILGKFGISASFCGALQKIANIIGWSILCFISFKYIKHRRKIWIWVLWVIAIVMIITGIILA